MFGRLIVLIVLVAAVLWFLHWFRNTPPRQVTRLLRRGALWGGIGLLVLMTATGRLNPLFAAFAAAIPVLMRAVNLLRILPVVQQVLRSLGLSGIPGVAGGSNPGGGGQTSSIRTRFLEMTLDHESGHMDGLVLEGNHKGRLLSDLGLHQLLDLLHLYLTEDAQSASLLETFLDRTQGEDWRESLGGGGERSPAPNVPMNRDEALAVLGLDAGASEQEIKDAHRRLIQRFHPDRGGSDYLAAKINEAKRLLLDG